MGWSILYLKGSQVRITNYDVFLSLRIDFTLINSEVPDEMPHYVAFCLGLHCLSEYTFRGSSIQRDKAKVINQRIP